MTRRSRFPVLSGTLSRPTSNDSGSTESLQSLSDQQLTILARRQEEATVPSRKRTVCGGALFYARPCCVLRSVLQLPLTLLRDSPLSGKTLVILSCLLPLAVANESFAWGASQVAFIGDNLTYEWQQQPQFRANSNWLRYGFNMPGKIGAGWGTATALTELQQIIASGKTPIIHLVVGQIDADGASPGNQPAFLLAVFASNIEKIIATAQNAHLKIILGTIPYASHGDVGPLNLWLFQYCGTHGIPIVNYAFALNSGTGFAASRAPVAPPPAYYNPSNPPSGATFPTITSAGWALITDMAETQIGLTEGLFKLVGGFINDVVLEDLENSESVTNSNSFVDGSTVQFTPYGEFNDGKTRILNNADQYGHVGTWVSSSSKVVTLNQYGVGISLSKGSSDINFISNSGIPFNELTVSVAVDDPSGGAYSNY
jgi:hypothetical protein